MLKMFFALFGLLVLIGVVLLLLIVALEVLTYSLRQDHPFVLFWRKHIISDKDLEP
jgi:hypothetical protein